MHFTLTFVTKRACDLSYGLAFVPNPVWMRGFEVLAPLHTTTGRYQSGGIRLLLEREQLLWTMREADRCCAILVRDGGGGTLEDLERLTAELVAGGWAVQVTRLDLTPRRRTPQHRDGEPPELAGLVRRPAVAAD